MRPQAVRALYPLLPLHFREPDEPHEALDYAAPNAVYNKCFVA